MFKEMEQEAIGRYLAERIDAQFSSRRAFFRQYLAAQGTEATNEGVQKMANRLSQILKGAKGIQIHDLPIFTDLLDVTCEEILSAGTCRTQRSRRMTNYMVAFSNEERVWEKYIHHRDKPFLNADEYGRTVFDYALKCKNYAFLQFLMEHKYIWFDDGNQKGYPVSLGAGTSIKLRAQLHIDEALREQLRSEVLRREIIALAME